MKASIKVYGGDVIIKKLNDLERKIRRKIVSKVLRYTSKVFAAEIKARAPVRSGALARAVTVRATRRSRLRIGTQVLFGRSKLFTGDQYYGGMVEYGHYVGHRRLGNKRRYVEGQGFMRAGFKAKGPQMAREAPKLLWDEIAKAVR